jgi:hypothetical protein
LVRQAISGRAKSFEIKWTQQKGEGKLFGNIDKNEHRPAQERCSEKGEMNGAKDIG